LLRELFGNYEKVSKLLLELVIYEPQGKNSSKRLVQINTFVEKIARYGRLLFRSKFYNPDCYARFFIYIKTAKNICLEFVSVAMNTRRDKNIFCPVVWCVDTFTYGDRSIYKWYKINIHTF